MGLIQRGAVDGTRNADEAAAARRVAALRRGLTAELVGLGTTMTRAMDAVPGFVPCGHAFGVVLEGLAATVSCEDEGRISELTEDVRARSEHVSDHRGVTRGAVVDVMAVPGDVATPEAAIRAQVLATVRAAACDAELAMRLGVMSDDVNVALVRALDGIADLDAGLAALDAARGSAAEAALLAQGLVG